MHLLPTCFHIIRCSSLGCFALSFNVFLVLIYQTNMRVEKINMVKEREKSPLETKYEDELPRIRSCQQEGLKHRLIDVDAVPVLIRYAWKHRF